MSSLLNNRVYKIAARFKTSLAIMLFGCVMIGVTFAIVRKISSPASRLLEGNRSSGSSIKHAVKFRSIAIFDGTREDGTRFSNEVYKSSDCSTVIKGIELFDSDANALAQLKRQLSQAEKVLERGPKLSTTGQPTQKVKLAFLRDSERKQYSIFWTEKSELHSISADSLRDAEEFENWLTADKQPPDSVMATKDLTFLPSPSTSGTKEGVAFFEQQFKSTGCVTLLRRTEYVDTRVHAEELLQRKVQSAVQLIERGPQKVGAGQRLGERAVIVLAPDRMDDFQHKFVVLWTEDSELHSIEAPILNYVLEFEKRYYGQNAAQ